MYRESVWHTHLRQRLLQAEEINDLAHGTIWEEKLWAALRKAGIMAERKYQ